MRNFRKGISVAPSLCILVLLICCAVQAQETTSLHESWPDHKWQQFQEQCRQAAAVEDQLRTKEPIGINRKDQLQELSLLSSQLLQQWQGRLQPPVDPVQPSSVHLSPPFANDVFRYYEARLELLAGHKETARQKMAQLVDSPAVAPEAALAFFEATTAKERQVYYRTMHRLLPTSFRGGVVVEFKDRSNPHAFLRPIIPEVTVSISPHNQWIKAADGLMECGLYEEAALAYREAIYTCGSPSWIGNGGIFHETWISPFSAPLWLKLAQCQWISGDNNLLASDIAKAYIFGTAATREQAAALCKVIQEAKQNPRDDVSQRKAMVPEWNDKSCEKLLSICRIYKDIRLNPRGIELLRRYGPQFEGKWKERAKLLEEELMNSWLSDVRYYCSNVQGKCELMGQDVTRPEQRYFVIPAPASAEARQQAKEFVQGLLKTP